MLSTVVNKSLLVLMVVPPAVHESSGHDFQRLGYWIMAPSAECWLSRFPLRTGCKHPTAQHLCTSSIYKSIYCSSHRHVVEDPTISRVADISSIGECSPSLPPKAVDIYIYFRRLVVLLYSRVSHRRFASIHRRRHLLCTSATTNGNK